MKRFSRQPSTFQSAAGGAAGYTMQEAFRYGVARGLFTNDAGKGTAPSMHATAVVPHPVNQGFAAMLGTFITTIIICSCTAFCILLSGQIGSGEQEACPLPKVPLKAIWDLWDAGPYSCP